MQISFVSSPPSFLLVRPGREVDVLPVWRLHPAGGAADAEHHGGVRLAHLLHRHVKVSGLPGVHQHLEDDSGQQVGSAGCLFILIHFQFCVHARRPLRHFPS